MNWFSPEWLLLKWLAARNGRSDGRRMIPDPQDSRPPAYLNYLRRWGEKRGQRLAVRWQRLDLRLSVAYRQAAVMYAQESQALERAAAREAELLSQWQARKTQANRAAWQRAHTATEEVRRRRDRAEQRLKRTIAVREAKYAKHLALWHNVCEDTAKLMAVYVKENVRTRDGNEVPPALHEDNWPQLRRPEKLDKKDED